MFIPAAEYVRILEVMPILCVDLLIVDDRRCLVLKRDNEPAKGQYWFPGGRVRKLESIETAAARIAKAETNLDCTYVRTVCVTETIFPKTDTMDADVHTVNVCCELSPSQVSSLQLDGYHTDYQWIGEQCPEFHDAVNQPLAAMGFPAAR